MMEDFTAMVLRGCNVPVFTRGPAPKAVPPWLDEEKFRRGQKFAKDHSLGTILCEAMCLILLFAYPDGMQALIFSEVTDTVDKAKKRYLSTVNRILHWYKSDLWSKSTARRHIEVVRSKHGAIQRQLTETPIKEVLSKTTLANKFIPKSSTPIVVNGLFLKDIKESVMEPKPNQIPVVTYGQENCCPFNHAEILMTQFSFVGLLILHPEKFGASDASDEDLEAFTHMWRGIVYLLGISDEYNFCAGDLATIKTNSKQVIDKWLKPSLLTCSEEWEHMSRCMVATLHGLLDLESLLFYTCNTIMGIPMPEFQTSLGWSSRLKITVLDFVLTKVYRVTLFRRAINWLIETLLHGSQKNYEKRSCPYSQLLGLKNKVL